MYKVGIYIHSLVGSLKERPCKEGVLLFHREAQEGVNELPTSVSLISNSTGAKDPGSYLTLKPELFQVFIFAPK